MTDLFFKDMVALKPNNWEELANSAKFLRGTYTSYCVAAEKVLSTSVGASKARLAKLAMAVSHISHFGEYRNIANAVYLASRSACIDNKPGDFSTSAQIEDRMGEAIGVGSLIEQFVDAGQILSVTSLLFKGAVSSNPRVTEAESLSHDKIFEYPKEIMEKFAKGGIEIALPTVDTVIQIIREENGILRADVEGVIRSAFNPGANIK